MSSIEKLNGPNYLVWSLRVKRLLQSHELWDVVEPVTSEGQVGEQALATPGDALAGAPPPSSDFAIRDAKASCLIMDFCDTIPLNLIVSVECARSQWARLRMFYGPSIENLEGLQMAFFNSTAQTRDKGLAQIAAEMKAWRDQIGEVSKEERPTDELMLMALIGIVCRKGEAYRELLRQLRGEVSYD